MRRQSSGSDGTRAKKPAAEGWVALGPHGVRIKWGQILGVGESCPLLRAPTMGGPILHPQADLFTPVPSTRITALQKAPGGLWGCRGAVPSPWSIAARGRAIPPRSPRPNPSHGTGRMRPFAHPLWHSVSLPPGFGCFFSISSPSRCPRPDPAQLLHQGLAGSTAGAKCRISAGFPS